MLARLLNTLLASSPIQNGVLNTAARLESWPFAHLARFAIIRNPAWTYLLITGKPNISAQCDQTELSLKALDDLATLHFGKPPQPRDP